MQYLINIIVSFVILAIMAVQLLMMARAILSWIPRDGDSALDRFLFITTEPVISPIRNILDRMDLFSGLPIDLSFLVTYILLSLILGFLPDVRF